MDVTILGKRLFCYRKPIVLRSKKATAIPRITSDFHSIDNVGWYGAVYELSITALQPSVMI